MLVLVGLAFAVIMIRFVILVDSSDSITRENCGRTVDRMHTFNVAGAPVDDLSLDCPTVKVTIDGEDNRENNKIMANAMYDCATQFRRGNREIFSNDGVYCNVCYIFDVQERVDGFYDYLIKNKVPGTSGETYHQYMQGQRSVGAKKVLDELEHPLTGYYVQEEGEERRLVTKPIMPREEIETVVLPPDHYAVIFIYARGQENLRKVWRHATAQSDAGKAGLAVGGTAFLTFSTAAGAATLATYMIPALATGPVGVIILGTGVVIGVGAFTVAEVVSYKLSRDVPPEYASFFVFRKWDADTNPDNMNSARNLLSKDIGCNYLI